MASRLLRLIEALVRDRDVHYARRLIGRAWANLRLVGGALGAHYVRIHPWRDFGGFDGEDACGRFEAGRQPAGFVRMNLIPYHLALPDVAGRVVVEAGANEGAGAALFARHAREVHAFDVSAEAIAVANRRPRPPNLHFSVHDATRPFPLPDGSAGVVFASEVIEHLADGRAFLDHAARVLEPGGRLILKTPNVAYNRYENRMNVHHVNPYDAGRLRRQLEERFDRVEIEGLTYRIGLATSAEDRPDAAAPEDAPYAFGDPVVVDRVLVTRLTVTPVRVAPGGVPEFLFARATRRGAG